MSIGWFVREDQYDEEAPKRGRRRRSIEMPAIRTLIDHVQLARLAPT
jgi:hypothetical protein